MRLVHFADTHLGFRQFDRVTSIGVNRREADVEDSFHTLIDRVIALAPDVAIVGGDVFHIPRPSNHAIVNAIQEFQRLVRAVPCVRIVLVAGNHDSPRSTDTGGILGSLAPLGIHIVDRQAARIVFDDVSLNVLAIPEAPGVVMPECKPDPAFKYNVMVMHGEVAGMPGGHDRSKEVSHDQMRATEWDYIGLGHYHVYQELAPNMFYSGSINYTSSDPWGEMAQEDRLGLSGKGFVERDLDTGVQTFHPLTVTRPYLDLPTFSALDMTGPELNAAIRQVVESSATPIDGKATRLVVTEVSRELAHEVDHAMRKEFQLRSLNFHLDLRRASVTRVVVGGGTSRHKSLREIVVDKLKDMKWPAGVDAAMASEGALAYLDQTEDPYAVADPFGNEHSLADLLSASIEDAKTEAAQAEPQLDLSAA